MDIDLSGINLTRGPDPSWVQLLPVPFCDFTPAETLGQLVNLAPSMWPIMARHCFLDTVVYGNRRHSFGIQLKDNRWVFRYCEGVNNVALHGYEMHAALLADKL